MKNKGRTLLILYFSDDYFSKGPLVLLESMVHLGVFIAKVLVRGRSVIIKELTLEREILGSTSAGRVFGSGCF